MADTAWRTCSACRSPIGVDTVYWVCNVSTCNTKRRGLFFCSVDCWETHLPVMRHRTAYAIERRSPSASALRQEQEQKAQKSTSKAKKAASTGGQSEFSAPPDEVLIVASRLNDYVEEHYKLRVSKSALHGLSARLRRLADEAITRAGFDGRKTIMDRDFAHARGASDGPVLVIVSRFKAYVKAAGDMNTAGNVIDVLSKHIRAMTDAAARSAVSHSNAESLTELDFDRAESTV